jgi:superfamily II DNA or RNA helicase
MLLDNKNELEKNEPYKVFDFIEKHIGNGNFDLVTGFFSINALAFMKDKINKAESFKLILGNLMQDEVQLNKTIDLINGNPSIKGAFSLPINAQKAVAFLEQDKVLVKSIQSAFCHAKAYIYSDKESKNNFHIIGSSNLTDAGLGVKESSNIELNTASTGKNNDYKELKKWFQQQWDNASETIEIADKTKIGVKEHIIELIKKLFKEYTPKELYYKVLYELFKDNLLELSDNPEFKRGVAYLEETILYKTLFPYQQKGAISLIKMLNKFNGAILADAVGLGKTWTALAVMKYFEMSGYTVVLLCPKKLRNNWEQYQSNRGSKFEKDEIQYYVRNHTDLQDERLEQNYQDFPLSKLQRRQKLLLVIDESHNLRNDKSSRYNFLVDNILQSKKESRDVKVLLLSATPINNKLIDIRNQFKLMVKGQDDGFKNTDLEIDSLKGIFTTAQIDFNVWSNLDDRKIADFISKLPPKFEKLTDALIVARTRNLIEGEFGEMKFPKREKDLTDNQFITPQNIGELKTFDNILKAIESLNFTAYRPFLYIADSVGKCVLDNLQKREGFLVKMIHMLLIKRLESSWVSFKSTVANILAHHKDALKKVNKFILNQADSYLQADFSADDQEDLEDTANENEGGNEEANEIDITLGKKNPISLSAITDIKLFKQHLAEDVNRLEQLESNLDKFKQEFDAGKLVDEKFNKLLEYITQKQANPTNKKALVFTAFKDTAKFLYEQLKKKGIKNIAFVSGGISETDGYSSGHFEPILERFAPFTKLYNEKDWSELYEKANLSDDFKVGGQWKVTHEKWLELIAIHDTTTLNKIKVPIDILIATDCLSEGQNLQDCDLVINYDIHWNPVRLIQRMGRIDRIGSPNKTIKGVNFWPAENYEGYLNLKSRVENRMALMTLVGTELDGKITPELAQMIKDNPLISKQAEKMLRQLEETLDNVEVSDETLGFNDLSLEQFRQELFEFFKQNEEHFQKIPNGVFTGFKYIQHLAKLPKLKWQTMPNSIVAILGYPNRPDEATNHVYNEIYLLHQNLEDGKIGKLVLNNYQEILTLLRHHKDVERFVPIAIDKGEKAVLDKLATAVGGWAEAQTKPVAIDEIQDLFAGTPSSKENLIGSRKVEDKFRSENFDLINWFIVSN